MALSLSESTLISALTVWDELIGEIWRLLARTRMYVAGEALEDMYKMRQ
jgi:hypothetical protein